MIRKARIVFIGSVLSGCLLNLLLSFDYAQDDRKRIPLPSRLGSKVCADEPGFDPLAIKTKIVATPWPPKLDRNGKPGARHE
jgi:hypothetical protein